MLSAGDTISTIFTPSTLKKSFSSDLVISTPIFLILSSFSCKFDIALKYVSLKFTSGYIYKIASISNSISIAFFIDTYLLMVEPLYRLIH